LICDPDSLDFETKMSQFLKHSALAWVLIVTQLSFSVFGPGQVVVCHDEDGPSHIELIHSDSSPDLVAENCGQVSTELDRVAASLCAGSPCVDEAISFTTTINNRRGIVDGSFTDLILTGVPLSLVCVLSQDSTMEQLGQDTGHEVACRLLGLQSSLRTTVLVL